jgi:hypothetical protein
MVGRQTELRRLLDAIVKRESLLIWGPAGAGKTRLVQTALSELPGEIARRCLQHSGEQSLQEVLRGLVRWLADVDDPLILAKFRAEKADYPSFKSWLQEQTSLRLRGLLYRAATERQYWIFLDHMPPLSHAFARVIKELIWKCKTPVYLLASRFSPEHIGKAWSLYWTNRYRMEVEPLPESEARDLLESCIRRFALVNFDLLGFREEILRLSGHLPGAIARMCALAAEPRYHYARRIKTRLVHVDYLLAERVRQALAQSHSLPSRCALR